MASGKQRPGQGRAGVAVGASAVTVAVVAGSIVLALVVGLLAGGWLVGSGRWAAFSEVTPPSGATPAAAPTPARTAAAGAATAGPAPVAPTARPAVGQTAAPAAAAPTAQCPAPEGMSSTSVRVGLTRNATVGPAIAFGLPLPPGAVADARAIRVLAAGQPVATTARVLLSAYGPDGAPKGPRAVLIQLPPTVLQGDCGQVEVTWQGGSSPTMKVDTPAPLPYTATSVDSPSTVETATRTIEVRDGQPRLVETARAQRLLFTAREPAVLATFPAGYLATTGILGRQVSSAQVGADMAGLKFISDQVTPFGLSAMYQERYALNPDAVIGPDDLNEKAGITGYEAWLYDRCATFLLFAAHTSDTRFLREGYRSCSYYASRIELTGENRGIFTGKKDPDPKYSHVRGLYAYYALTGDQAALEAGRAIAELWLNDQNFVAPYRAGRLRGPDKLWTERLLGTSLEGLYFGHLLTGEPGYLRAAGELVTTAHRHVTGDAAALATINPGSPAFPPQNCFIHTALQAAEGDDDKPWCSGWMPVMLVDSLLAYQDQTGDAQVDEIFIRLTRFLRDSGTSYFRGDVLQDSFLQPSRPYDQSDAEDPRMLVPLYGAGIGADGKLQRHGEYDDIQHCVDATALTAAGLRALKRSGGYDQHPIGPFLSEGASFLALHQELAFCASVTFRDQTRLNRDPAAAKPADLAQGVADPKAYIAKNKIGYPSRNVAPQRKLGWWFNAALGQFALLAEAGIGVPDVRPGAVQPAGATKRP